MFESINEKKFLLKQLVKNLLYCLTASNSFNIEYYNLFY